MNALTVAHEFIKQHTPMGGSVIDATAGRGGDTALLCSLVGGNGKVIALDIQESAVMQTRERIAAEGFGDICNVFLDSHENLANYAQPDSLDGIVFNFGWLPGGDHSVFTTPATSIPAIDAALTALRPGGALSLCLYYGGRSGYAERDAVLAHLETLDNRKYTVMVTRFANRTGDVPIPVFIVKEG